MDERVALVTGAASGIGEAVAAAFAERGWRVVAVDVAAPERDGPADRIERVDLAEPGAVEGLVERVEKEEGRLDALVNNAAVQLPGAVDELELEAWRRTLAVNLTAPFWTIRCAADLLAASGGSVVNVSSVHAEHTSRGMAAYAASKGGLAALTRAAALDLAPRGVRVNAVAPGAVDTPMLRAGLEREHLAEKDGEDPVESFARRQPVGRVAEPAEVAEAVLFLADGPGSAFVTGETLVVDGGATVRLSTE